MGTSKDTFRRSKTTMYLSTTEMNPGKNSSLGSDRNVELSQEEAWQVYLQSSEVQVRTKKFYPFFDASVFHEIMFNVIVLLPC